MAFPQRVAEILRRSASWGRAFGNDIERTPWKRNTARGAFIALYAACGIAGYRYLQDTRYRATGEESPYKKPEAPKGGIVDPHDTTPIYDNLAREYDSKIWTEELTSYIWWMRRRLGKHVTGDALEVAAGTGRNIRWLNPKHLRSVTFLDSSRPMLEVAQEKWEDRMPSNLPVQFVQGRAELLTDLVKQSGLKFDTVYESFGLCSHEDPDMALQNMAKLLKPNGEIVLLEHGRGYFDTMNQRMDARAEERAKEWGCRWNLDIDDIVKRSGMRIVEKGHYHFGTVSFFVLKLPSQNDTTTEKES